MLYLLNSQVKKITLYCISEKNCDDLMFYAGFIWATDKTVNTICIVYQFGNIDTDSLSPKANFIGFIRLLQCQRQKSKEEKRLTEINHNTSNMKVMIDGEEIKIPSTNSNVSCQTKTITPDIPTVPPIELKSTPALTNAQSLSLSLIK